MQPFYDPILLETTEGLANRRTAGFQRLCHLGLDEAFEPGSYRPSSEWIAISFVLGFLAAILGGFVCAAISRDAGGPNLLAAAVLVLGLVSAGFTLWQIVDEPESLRPAGVEITEAARHAQQPAWVAFVNPFIGVAGILLGCRLRRRRPQR